MNKYKKLLRQQFRHVLHIYQWQIKKRILEFNRRFLYLIRISLAKPELRSVNGRRFLELHYLIKDYLFKCIRDDSERAQNISKQLYNVLNKCDEITYDDPGTAEAYAFLHFLDRYHRFQIVFDFLHANKLMPIKNRNINILDIGTGPGPSMYAISDFYTNIYKKQKINNVNNKFHIDYVERSREFRNWLHWFTEHANYYSPTKKHWEVPYHHGSFFEFEGLEFNKRRTYDDYDNDGDRVIRKFNEKYRFDIIVFSNFLTTKEKVMSSSAELKDCARFLRNNGILIVVGAKSTSKKYRMVYEEISKVILSQGYSNWKLIAKCEKVNFENLVMRYKWNDAYGEIIKELIRDIYKKLCSIDETLIPLQSKKTIDNTIQTSYDQPIEWEIHVFRKTSRMRKK